MLTSRHKMGAALWVASALVLFLIARVVPPGRSNDYLRELMIALAAAILCGAIATALDFGGWRVADWRAIAFVACGTAAAIGGGRILNFVRN